MNTVSAGFAAPSQLGTGRLSGNPYGLGLRSGMSAIRPGGAGSLLGRSLGGGLDPVLPAPTPQPSLPPTSAAAKPASADHGLPLSPRR